MTKQRHPTEIEQDIERTRMEMRQTLEALERKLAPRQLVDQAMTSLRGVVSGELGIGRVVRDHPVPIAIAAIGLGWLAIALSGRRENAPEEVTLQHYDPYLTREDYGATLYSGQEMQPPQAGALSSSRQAMMEKARSYAKAATRKASEITGGTSRAVSDYAEDVKDWSQDVAWRAKQAARRGSDIVQDYPLATGAVALILGGVIGAALSRTRAESRLFGEARQDLLESVKQGAAQTVRQGEHIAAATVEGARREAKRAVQQETDQGPIMH